MALFGFGKPKLPENPEELVSLGVAYYKGNDREKDLNMAFKCFEKAAQKGSAAGEAPDEAFLVLCGCDSAFLNKVLQALRTPGVPPLPLKATLTPHNVNWTARQLFDEICRERAEMEKR